MSFDQNYSLIDRILHHAAFFSPVVQKTLADIENEFFKSQLATSNSSQEVFVTSLPRAGTTLMLDLLYSTGEFKTFSYRHMPFIMSPVLWPKISRPFSKKATNMERAHGDGVQISFDSPEAFEEVIWQTYLHSRIVRNEHLSPLELVDISDEFKSGITNTIKKLLFDEADPVNKIFRYLSKNNANCSRIGVLKSLFPSAAILIPFRFPFAHISSLHKQHTLFTNLHKNDPFARKYMEWLGHYDFGANFKPINFNNWLAKSSLIDYSKLEFWLEYWIASFDFMLKQSSDRIFFINFDELLTNSKESLDRISIKLNLENKSKLIDSAKMIRTPTTEPVKSKDFSQELVSQALDIHRKLQVVSIN